MSTRLVYLTAVALGFSPFLAVAEEGTADGFSGMFTEGKASFKFRYRFEFVDDDASQKDAEASTLLSRLTFASASWQGLSFLAEVDNVSAIGDENYNSTSNGNTEFPVVADPEGTEINQAWLRYASGDASGTAGRQNIVHGSERFIGGVAWRQNEQTYDGFRALYAGDNGLKIDYAYVYNVNRIFGPDDGPVQPANLDGDNHFLRADWTFAESHTITGLVYLLDIDENPDYPAGRTVGNSSDTYGIQYAGSFGPMTAKLAYATQSDAGDSQLEYDADYYLAEGSFTVAGVKAIVGYEVLGAGDGVGFKTPYATLHKFQGWADKFLVTPADGIEDLYVGVTGKIGPVKLGGFYHDFSAEDASGDYGSEVDLVATWPYNDLWTFQLKYANFSSDSDNFTDTEKAWLSVIFKI
jgi:hypothetical protein